MSHYTSRDDVQTMSLDPVLEHLSTLLRTRDLHMSILLVYHHFLSTSRNYPILKDLFLGLPLL